MEQRMSGREGDSTGSHLFHRILDRLPAGAYMCDPEGLITYFNRHAAELWGREPDLDDPADRYCGSVRLFDTAGAPIDHDACWMALALREEREYHGEEIVVERPDGTRITVLAHATPIRDDAGALLGAVNVLVDITGQKRVEAAFAEADHAKNEFLATMSHEIRTPINAILGYVDLLNLEIPGRLSESQRLYLGRVQSAGRHLLSLVDQVLDLSRLQADQVVVQQDVLRAAETADAAIAVVQPLAAARGIVLRCAGSPAAGDSYVGDEDRVRQMLINLLSNAAKFSDPGDSIELSWEMEESESGQEPARWLCFRVADTGPGIAADQLSRIFEPFVQLEPARTRTRGGSGLGLAISRRLARQMGGDLSVESEVGVGSTFMLRLPASDPTAEPPRRSEVPGPGVGADLFSAAGHLLLASVDDILAAFVNRLRSESLGPGVAAVSSSHLAKHPAMFVTQIAVGLLTIEQDAPLPGSDTEILRVCATEHGRHRASFGWSDGHVSRELDLLADELVRRVRRLRAREEDLRPILGAVRWRIAQAKGYSLRALDSMV